MSTMYQPAQIPTQYAQQGAYMPQQPMPPQLPQQLPINLSAQQRARLEQAQRMQHAAAMQQQMPIMQHGMPFIPPQPMPPQYQPSPFQQQGNLDPSMPQIPPPSGLYTLRVISGTHRGNRQIFQAGQTFRTREPLYLMFENKFQLVPDAPVTIEDSSAVPDRMIPKTPQEVAQIRAARQQQAVAQQPAVPAPVAPQPPVAQQQPAVATPPEIPMQPFPAIHSPIALDAPPPLNSIPVVDEPLVEVTYPFDSAENLTKKFPKAKKNGMEVWQHPEAGFAISVIDPQNPTSRYNIADAPLTSITDVNKYLVDMAM